MTDIRSSVRVVRAKAARNGAVYRDDAYAANRPCNGGRAYYRRFSNVIRIPDLLK